MDKNQPNIVVIMADFMGALALPAYGNVIANTPNLRALAEDGVVFENAYCNSPVCAPSRASMLTGLLPSRIGVYDNGCDFSSGIPTFAHHLRLAGYRTVLSGKMHFIGPDQLHGFESRLTPDQVPSDFGWSPPPGGHWVEKSYSPYPNLDAVVEAGIAKRSLGIDFDEEVAFTSTRTIYDIARDDDPRPFMLVASFIQPHHPLVTTQTYWDRYAEVDIPMPEVPAIPVQEMDLLSRALYQFGNMDDSRITDEIIRRARRAYYGMLSHIDDKIGELRKALHETGLGKNTLIVVTSDHGNMLGERGMWGIRFPFEAGTRVPLIFHQPDEISPRRVSDIVSLVDLAPTLIDLTGVDVTVEHPSGFDGLSLHDDLFGNRKSDPQRTVFVEYCGEGVPTPWFMVRHGTCKLIHCEAFGTLLFDLTHDPEELHNLISDPAYSEVRHTLMNVLSERWDREEILSHATQSRCRRDLVYRAHARGDSPVWDYAMNIDPVSRYQRNYREPWQATEARALLR